MLKKIGTIGAFALCLANCSGFVSSEGSFDAGGRATSLSPLDSATSESGNPPNAVPVNSSPADAIQTVPYAGDAQNTPSMPIGEVSMPIDVIRRSAFRSSMEVEWICQIEDFVKLKVSGYVTQNQAPLNRSVPVRIVENVSKQYFDLNLQSQDGTPGYFEGLIQIAVGPTYKLSMFFFGGLEEAEGSVHPCEPFLCESATGSGRIVLPLQYYQETEVPDLPPCPFPKLLP